VANNLTPGDDGQSLYFARSDISQLLGTFSAHPFTLEDKEWPSVEHYFQAMKFEAGNHQNIIRSAAGPKKARKLGRTRFEKIRNDWSTARTVFMTRAIYTKCRTYPDVSALLLSTDSQKLVESSQYDYFWGCGRDRRGENMYGQILMNVRDKLVAEKGA
jgi:ribA/ribD-fused uncharacterized protein